MRVALWILALFAVAVAAALFAGSNPGSVTLFWPPYRVDLSLNLVLLLLVGAFLTVHLALRALTALFAIPREARQWRLRQRERAMQQALLEAASQLISGRYVRARKAAESVLLQVRSLQASGDRLGYGERLQAMAHLVAAEASHALQDRTEREQHAQAAMAHAGRMASPDTREGLQLRAARWALDDRDPLVSLELLGELGQGGARRVAALRLQLKAARLAGHSQQALDTARLLAKHRALSETAAQGIVQGLALEQLQSSHDPSQVHAVWARLDAAERAMPDVAMQAAERLLNLGGSAAVARGWLLPVWEQLMARPSTLAPAQAIRLVRALERGFDLAHSAPEVEWLSRIETAQLQNPGDALLQYLAGVACKRLQLWGKARQLLSQCQARLPDTALRRSAWRHLAELAEQDGDNAEAAAAWRKAAVL